MWMCCTCGYGAPLNVAAKPLKCSVMVATSPLSIRGTVPEPVAGFGGASVAVDVVGLAALADESGATANASAAIGSAANRVPVFTSNPSVRTRESARVVLDIRGANGQRIRSGK